MAETAVPAPSPWVDIVKAAIPSLGQCLVLLTGLVVAIGTAWWVAKPGSLPAADPPKPTPVVSAGDVDHIVQLHCGEIKAMLDLRLPAPKVPRR